MWLTHVIFGDVRYDLECTERVFKSGLNPSFLGDGHCAVWIIISESEMRIRMFRFSHLALIRCILCVSPCYGMLYGPSTT